MLLKLRKLFSRISLYTVTTITLGLLQNIQSDLAQNHCLVLNAASVSYGLFMTFYAGCFISASFAGCHR